MYNILLETIWWTLSNATLIMGIYLVIPEIIYVNSLYLGFSSTT